jgi:hypothetical protein
VLPVSYYHLVFTLPHELNGWAQCHPEVIYHRLFRCVWACLDDYSRCNRQLEGKLGMTAVLHTWGQSLNQHIHLHCLIPGGAIDEQGDFVTTRRDFLYPQRVLARLLRGKMVSALRGDYEAGKLQRIAPQQVDDVLDQLMQLDWVIHTRPHLRQADTVLKYLAGEEFLRRFLLHILPKGLMRIRHYGYLANRVRVKQLNHIRQRLALQPEGESNAKSTCDDARPVNQPCPKCQLGVLRFVGEILSARQRRRYALSVNP